MKVFGYFRSKKRAKEVSPSAPKGWVPREVSEPENTNAAIKRLRALRLTSTEGKTNTN